jgi:hypothetical protein
MTPENDQNSHREKIAARAYALWEAEGRPSGRAQAHWQQAFDELGGIPALTTSINGDFARREVAPEARPATRSESRSHGKVADQPFERVRRAG